MLVLDTLTLKEASMPDADATTSGIYCIRCLPTGKVYVGSAVNLLRRQQDHQRCLRRGSHPNCHLQRAWDKHGSPGFAFEIVERVEPDKLLEREQHHIDLFKAFDRKYGFNLSPTAGSCLGHRQSDEVKAKHAVASTGKKHSPETRARLAEINRNMPPEQREKIASARRGRKLTEEHRARISRGNTGKKPSQKTLDAFTAFRSMPRTPEHTEKIAAANRGRSLSPEHRAKLSESLRGRPVSQETRAKIATAHTGRRPSEEARQKMRAARVGKKLSEETKAKLRHVQVSQETRKKLSDGNRNRPPEWRAKISAAQTGRKATEETRAKLREAWQRRRARKIGREIQGRLFD